MVPKSSPVGCEKRTVVRASAGKDSHVKVNGNVCFQGVAYVIKQKAHYARLALKAKTRLDLQRVVGKREYKRHGERGRDVGNVGEELRDDGE